ncbi:MAG: GatB/YqeY domain-containing protein [Chitinophagales bacterium]
MSLKDTLLEDLKTAMKAREAGKIKVSVIRLTRAAIQTEEIDKRRDLTEAELLEVLSREIKKRKEALPDYQKAGRDEAVKQLLEEITILQAYLPEQLSEEDIRSLIKEVINGTGAQGVEELGRVMKVIIPKTKGRADGKLVSDLVKEILVKK